VLCPPQAMARLRERGRDGCLAGIQVQHLFCSNNTTIPEHQLKELNMKIDNALQVHNQPSDQDTEQQALLFQWFADLKNLTCFKMLFFEC